MPRLRPILLLAGALIAGGVLLGLVLFLGPGGGSSAFPPLPEPNGYLALVQAAVPLQPPPDGFRKLADDALEPIVAWNRAALAQVRLALQQPGAVPVQFSQSWFSTVHSLNLARILPAARALQAEVEWRLRRADIPGALDATLDGFRFSEAVQRGGLLVDHLVGSACEAQAWGSLTNILEQLPAAECRRALRALAEFDARREPFAAIVKREREWSRRTGSVWNRVMERVRSLNAALNKSVRTIEAATEARLQSRIREDRALLLRLAARAHTLEKGGPPARAADLVPAYLERLPEDPVTGRALELP